jgi:PIF1 helicase.
MFFIDASGGTGKTFLINLILAKVRNNRRIALAVESSGIAVTLLPGGKTAYSMFKISINFDINEGLVCNVSKNSNKAELLQNACLIVRYECTMTNTKAEKAVDRKLQ